MASSRHAFAYLDLPLSVFNLKQHSSMVYFKVVFKQNENGFFAISGFYLHLDVAGKLIVFVVFGPVFFVVVVAVVAVVAVTADAVFAVAGVLGVAVVVVLVRVAGVG